MIFLRRTSHIVSMIALAAALCTLGIDASQQPQPARRNTAPQTVPKESGQPYNDEQIRKSIDGITTELKALGNELRAIREQQAATHQAAAQQQTKTDPPIYSNWALVILAGLTALFAFKNLGKLERQIKIATCATTAARDNASAALENASAAKASVEGMQRTERAYVALSHDEGLHIQPAHNRYRFMAAIKNSGRTPAGIVGSLVMLAPDLDTIPVSLPKRPEDAVDDGRSGRIAGAFLASDDVYRAKVFFRDKDNTLTEKIAEGKLWIIGYVDYRDVFGKTYRAPYGRWVKPGISAPKNNLLYDDTARAYNDDYEIDEQGNPKS